MTQSAEARGPSVEIGTEYVFISSLELRNGLVPNSVDRPLALKSRTPVLYYQKLFELPYDVRWL